MFLLLPWRIPNLVSLVFPYQIGIFHILPLYFPYLCLISLLLSWRIPTLVSLVFPYQIGIFHILPLYFLYLCLISLFWLSWRIPTLVSLVFPYQLGNFHILPLYFPYLRLISLLLSWRISTLVSLVFPYQLGIFHILSLYFFLTLPRSGKGPCIRHTYKRVQWEVGSRYINPIQPYRFCRRLYPCYQNRLCAIIQLDYEIVVVVI